MKARGLLIEVGPSGEDWVSRPQGHGASVPLKGASEFDPPILPENFIWKTTRFLFLTM